MALKLYCLILLCCFAGSGFAQKAGTDSLPPQPAARKWYEAISLRGYTQVRYNRLFETNPQLRCEQCDRSWGGTGGFSVRRMRFVFSGYVHPRIFFYIQPDFASSISSTGLNFSQLRDAYFDLGFDRKNEFRLRIGQSKMPYGFENLQSSGNRLPLDRADALNSALVNERDLGVLLYWAPQSRRELFSELGRDEMKGSGDFGVVGLGVFNGQGTNRPDGNDRLHVIGRISYPFYVGSQILEPGIQAYTGRYVVGSDQRSVGVKVAPGAEYLDQRAALSFTLYPRPFGLQAEYNVGRGPEFNPATDSIEVQRLHGGYAMVSYFLRFDDQLLFPFARIQYYDGGKKHELDTRSYTVRDFEIGAEWHPLRQLEFVVAYVFSARRFEDFVLQDNAQRGRLLRMQVQFNY